MLNSEQIQEIKEIVTHFHLLFIAKQVGSEILTEKDKKLLNGVGFKKSDFPKEGKIEEQFKFGMLSAAVKEAGIKELTFNQFKKFLSEQKFLPLTQLEQEALQYVKLQTYNDIKGLGDKMSKDFTQIIIDGDKRKKFRAQKAIKQQIERAIIERKSIKELSLELSKSTGNWAKDFDRVADYVMHDAFDMGRAMQILKTKGKDALVYKDVKPEACEVCQKAYLTKGLGSKPIVFNLQKLVFNGNNIGRKKAEMRPVVGPMHPWCRCTLQTISIGMEWDDKTKAFDKPISVKRRTESKIKIKVNGKEID